MVKEKIIYVFITLLVAVVAVLGYIFFDSYMNVYKSLKEKKEQPVVTDSQNQLEQVAPTETSNVPPGTQLPLGGDSSMPAANNPQDISLGMAGSNQGGQGNNQGSGQDQNQAPPPDLADVSKWKTYTNKKYNYSFKYPAEYDYSACGSSTPCRYGQVFERDGGDSAWLNGATNNQGWPYILITHTDDESLTLPKGTKFFDWLKQKFGWANTNDNNAPKDFNYAIMTAKGDPKKAMRISIPQTPQAYARDEIYFETNNKIFQIQLMDPSKEQAQQFYNTWLKTFVLN